MKLPLIPFLVALISLVVGFAGAGDGAKTKDLIVGTWKYEKTFKEKEDGKTVEIKVVIIAEFTKDGKWLIDSRTNEEKDRKEGTYKVLDEKTLETTLPEEKNNIRTNKLTIETLTRTKLVVFDEKTPRMQFERVQPNGKADVEEELKKFQGVWTFDSVEAGGKKLPADQFKEMTVTFEGDKYAVKKGDEVVEAATLKLDPSKSSPTLDATVTHGPNQGAVYLCIYEIRGDTLKVCFDPKGNRPTEFKTTPGSQTTLVVHKRVTK